MRLANVDIIQLLDMFLTIQCCILKHRCLIPFDELQSTPLAWVAANLTQLTSKHASSSVMYNSQTHFIPLNVNSYLEYILMWSFRRETKNLI